jgi:hypothetical protein
VKKFRIIGPKLFCTVSAGLMNSEVETQYTVYEDWLHNDEV